MAKKECKAVLKHWFALSGKLFLYCLPFTLIGLLFTGEDGKGDLLRAAIGFLFLIPVCVIFYYVGSSRAGREFSARNRMVVPGTSCNRIPFWFCFSETVVFIAAPLLLAVLGNLTGVIALQNIPLYVFVPAVMISVGLNLLSMLSLTWYSLLLLAGFELIVLTFYFWGYRRTERVRAESTKDITREIRHNDRIFRQ